MLRDIYVCVSCMHHTVECTIKSGRLQRSQVLSVGAPKARVLGVARAPQAKLGVMLAVFGRSFVLVFDLVLHSSILEVLLGGEKVHPMIGAAELRRILRLIVGTVLCC